MKSNEWFTPSKYIEAARMVMGRTGGSWMRSKPIIPREGVKCASCPTPIWRYLSRQQWAQIERPQQWVCLNCPLSDAIRGHDDDKREQIIGLIDGTKQASILAWQGGAR